MSEFISKPRNVLLSLVLLCAVVITAALVTRNTTHALLQDPPVDSHELAAALVRVGFDVDALAAAGLDGQDVEDVVDAVRAYLTQHDGELDDADDAYAQARREADMLRRLIRSGCATGEQVSAYAQAKVDLDDAAAARDDVLDAIYGVGVGVGVGALTQTQQSILSTIRANAAWRSPHNLQFLADDWTQQEWVDLRDALANERIAQKNGEYADAGCQTFLAVKRADADVTAARTNHAAYISTVDSAWNDAIDG
ncbi:MAG: hypothetical protein KAS72_11000 [Phycisphaerales bacterium]|nr:hypothetical protein [Phycisphaerales bacterium]